MRVIVTGGGTGGHIYPAIAIADKFKEMDPETQILYVGNDEGIEKDIVPKSGYELALVDARWLDKSNVWQLVKTGARVAKGTLEARRVIKKFKPDVVIGTGGYVCFPVIAAAKMYGAKTFLHEQNAYPGLANRTLEKHVDRVFLGFKDAQKYVSLSYHCPTIYAVLFSETVWNSYPEDVQEAILKAVQIASEESFAASAALDESVLKEIEGQVEINEIEANNELARNGLMEDDQSRPGRPLREYLSSLRDTNLLPQNIKQLQGLWRIKHSKTVMKVLQILQF